MFTGIIESIGKLKQKTRESRNMNLVIRPEAGDFLKDIRKGASIAVNGVCLTVTSSSRSEFSAFVSTETSQVTNLNDAQPGDYLNLERSLKLNSRLDGHLVSGHIDHTALVAQIYKMNRDYRLNLRLPPGFLKYIVPKGSLAVNGISLTIVRKVSDILYFVIIPETYQNTNIPYLKPGERVNIEIDMIAKYVWNFVKNR
ncbi:MAG: riboflavin synthase [bacterium]|nr:riboflavin synthase [bacterium]